MTAPGCQGPTRRPVGSLARDANDRMHEAIKAHPDRLGGFAALPTAGPRARSPGAGARGLEARAERRADQRPHPRQLSRRSQVLGHFRMRAGARRADLPAPHAPAARRLESAVRGVRRARRRGLGFSADTGAITCGWFSRASSTSFRLKIILGHNGEGLPFVMERINAHTAMDAERRGLKKSPLSTCARTCSSPPAAISPLRRSWACTWRWGRTRSCSRSTGPTSATTRRWLFRQPAGVGEADRAKPLAHLNAERLLRL